MLSPAAAVAKRLDLLYILCIMSSMLFLAAGTCAGLCCYASP